MTAPLVVDVTIEGTGWPALLPDAAAIAEETAAAAWRRVAAPAAGPVELSILLADDATVRRLNREHRGQDKPTNVLSFPIGGTISVAGAPIMLGDVVLASGIVAREAVEQHKPVAAHFRHLVVHGVLHLAGYDHIADGDADIMESLEVEILAALAVPNPYRLGEPAA